MKTSCVAVTLVVSILFASVASGQHPDNKRRLGILGALAGAGAGAAIGEDDGDAVPGAIIGGAIGLISGAGVGSALDEQEYRNQAIQQQLNYQRSQAVTMADVVSMTQAGLSESVIINHIQTHGIARPLAASDLIVLKQQGVSDGVISAMQSVPRGTTVIQQPAAVPVIVEEHYHTHPRPAWWHHHHWHRRHHHHRHRHPRSSFHWGVTIGN